jgi:hypothetical protein
MVNKKESLLVFSCNNSRGSLQKLNLLSYEISCLYKKLTMMDEYFYKLITFSHFQLNLNQIKKC